jgi:hypothetical protein
MYAAASPCEKSAVAPRARSIEVAPNSTRSTSGTPISSAVLTRRQRSR